MSTVMFLTRRVALLRTNKLPKLFLATPDMTNTSLVGGLLSNFRMDMAAGLEMFSYIKKTVKCVCDNI